MKLNGLRVENFSFSDSIAENSLTSWESIPTQNSNFLLAGESFTRSVESFGTASGVPLTPRPGMRSNPPPLWDSGQFDSEIASSTKLRDSSRDSDLKPPISLRNLNNKSTESHVENGHVVHNSSDSNSNDPMTISDHQNENVSTNKSNSPRILSKDTSPNNATAPKKQIRLTLPTRNANAKEAASGNPSPNGTMNGFSESLSNKVFLVKPRLPPSDSLTSNSPSVPSTPRASNGLSHGPMKSLSITRANSNPNLHDESQAKPTGSRGPLLSPLIPSPGSRFRAGLPEIKLDLRAVNRSRDMLEPTEMQLRRTKFAFFEKECSRVLEHVYLGSDVVARNRETLKRAGISHVLNCVGFVCPNYFADELKYKTLWLQDTPGEDITCVLYDVFDYIEDIRLQNGKVFVHCCQGVSRSTSLVIAYLMWLQGISFEDSFRIVKNVRGITNPNMGFACQLLQWQKRLGHKNVANNNYDDNDKNGNNDSNIDSNRDNNDANSSSSSVIHGIDDSKGSSSGSKPSLSPSSSFSERSSPIVRFYKMSPHSSQNSSHLVPKALSAISKSCLDSDAAFLLQLDGTVYCWEGKSCEESMRKSVHHSANQLLKYEKLTGPIFTEKEGEEEESFWSALNVASSSPSSCDFTFPLNLPNQSSLEQNLHGNPGNGAWQSNNQMEGDGDGDDVNSMSKRHLVRSLSFDCISPGCRKAERCKHKSIQSSKQQTEMGDSHMDCEMANAESNTTSSSSSSFHPSSPRPLSTSYPSSPRPLPSSYPSSPRPSSSSQPLPRSFPPPILPSPRNRSSLDGNSTSWKTEMWKIGSHSFPSSHQEDLHEKKKTNCHDHSPMHLDDQKQQQQEQHQLPEEMDVNSSYSVLPTTIHKGECAGLSKNESMFSFDLSSFSHNECPSPSLSFSPSPSSVGSSSVPTCFSSSTSLSSPSQTSFPNSPCASPLTSPRPTRSQSQSHVSSSFLSSSSTLSLSSSSSASSSSSLSLSLPPTAPGSSFARFHSLPSPSSFSPRSLSTFPPSGMGSYQPSVSRLLNKPSSNALDPEDLLMQDAMNENKQSSSLTNSTPPSLPPMLWPVSGSTRLQKNNSENENIRIPLYMRRSQMHSVPRTSSLSSTSSDPPSLGSEENFNGDHSMDIAEPNPFLSLSPPSLKEK